MFTPNITELSWFPLKIELFTELHILALHTTKHTIFTLAPQFVGDIWCEKLLPTSFFLVPTS